MAPPLGQVRSVLAGGLAVPVPIDLLSRERITEALVWSRLYVLALQEDTGAHTVHTVARDVGIKAQSVLDAIGRLVVDGRLRVWNGRFALCFDGRAAADEVETDFELTPDEPKQPKGPTPREKLFDGFEAWWKLQRRKVGKKAAQRAWLKLAKAKGLPPIGKLLAAQQAQNEAIFKHRELEHVPHPATWLNGRRWEDEIPEAQRRVPFEVLGGDGGERFRVRIFHKGLKNPDDATDEWKSRSDLEAMRKSPTLEEVT